MTDNTTETGISTNPFIAALTDFGVTSFHSTNVASLFMMRDKDAEALVSASRGAGSTRANYSRMNLLPAPYNAEARAVAACVTSARTLFVAMTLPFQKVGDGARGDRLVSVKNQFDAEYIGGMRQYKAQLAEAREELGRMLPYRIDQIDKDPDVLGAPGFVQAAWYPTSEDIEKINFAVTPPRPIAHPQQCTFMPVSEAMGLAYARNYEAELIDQFKFGQQDVAKTTIENVRRLADSYRNYAEYHDGSQEGRAPRVVASTLSNLQHSVRIMRQYAVDGTEEGRALVEIAGRIEKELAPPERTIEDVKSSPALARALSQKATTIMAEVEELDVLF